MNIDDRMAFGAPTEAEAIACEYDRIRSIERQFVVAFIHREVARLADTDDEHHTGNVLRALAVCIEHGDHRRAAP
jgi:hypothetical protein